MVFKLDHYHIFYNTNNFYNNDTTVRITNSDLSNFKLLGIADNKSKYTIEPKDVFVTSAGNEIIASYNLEIQLNIVTEIEDIYDTLINSDISVVLVPRTVTISENTQTLAEAGNLNNAEIIVFKPARARIIEDVKMGVNEVNPKILKFTTSSGNQKELKKVFVVSLS